MIRTSRTLIPGGQYSFPHLNCQCLLLLIRYLTSLPRASSPAAAGPSGGGDLRPQQKSRDMMVAALNGSLGA